MKSFKLLNNIVGWTVFAIAATTYYLTAEPTGSLWDCGEFIAGAYKLEVVHPPGAPLFLMIGRMFISFADIFTDIEAHPENIAFSINVMSGICTAFAAMFVCWSTSILAKLTLVGRDKEATDGETIAILGAGLTAGLATTFATSIWFSAVEGEVYAMSTFFTAIVLWAMLKWYNLPDNRQTDRWMIFAIYMAGLSIGVHLLSLLTIPSLALLYYFKKYENPTLLGMAGAFGVGAALLVLVQGLIILKLPSVGANFDYLFVNTFSLPFGSGLTFFVFLVIGLIMYGLYRTHQSDRMPLWGLLATATTFLVLMGSGTTLFLALLCAGGGAYAFMNKIQVQSANVQKSIIGLSMILVGFSTYGMIIIRANADTPINMNKPSHVFSLVSYLNREQYGDRPLFYGPHYAAQPVKLNEEKRYGPLNGKYEAVDKKVDYAYRNQDKMLLPRISHYDRGQQYERWLGKGKPNMVNNISFAIRYQIGWMYWRYFMWNFAGRQNAKQGFEPWDVTNGHWLSGIGPLDAMRLHPQSNMPETMKNQEAYNKYYLLPFIFGLLGIFFFYQNNRNDAIAMIILFLMTGLAITFYSNQPPNEPRERDYVLVGSIFAYCMWIGMGVLAIFTLLKERFKLEGKVSAIAAVGLVMLAPILMGTQNWDDHDRSHHYAARDYAVNFLESCAKDAIIFTHGDNDTYPLWYAQEVENKRRDVRVVNLSLLAVDWYIDQLRRKVNDSPAIKLSIPAEAYRGNKRNQVPIPPSAVNQPRQSLESIVKFMGDSHPIPTQGGQLESYLNTKNAYIAVDKQKVIRNGTVLPADASKIVDKIEFTINKGQRLIKDEIAILDIIASNQWDRPIYFAVTCRPEKMLGLRNYTQLEGMALRLIPVKSEGNPRFGFIGSGQVATDLMYNNIMTKFKWGNFDKADVLVDRSYGPSIQSTRMGILRLAEVLTQQGDNERAANIIDKYFESYPHMNFPYDYNAMYMIHGYYRANAQDRAKPHVQLLAKETANHLRFYASMIPDGKPLRPESLPTKYSGFNFDFRQALGVMNELSGVVGQSKDEGLKKDIATMFAPYR